MLPMTRCLLFALSGLALSGARADGTVFCPIEPVGEPAPVQKSALFMPVCAADRMRVGLDTPRARPIDAGPSVVKARFGTIASEQLSSALLGTLKFDWAGLRTDTTGGLRTQHANVVASGRLEIVDDWFWQFNVNRELAGGLRTRTEVASVWQPIRTGQLFAEWAAVDNHTDPPRLGGRWWLMPGRLALDFGARYLPDGSWGDRRLGFTLQVRR